MKKKREDGKIKCRLLPKYSMHGACAFSDVPPAIIACSSYSHTSAVKDPVTCAQVEVGWSYIIIT